MSDLYASLPLIVRLLIPAVATIAVLFPIAAACSMAERKVAAWIQDRPGPTRASIPWLVWIPVIGPLLKRFGLFQLMADGGKLLLKEDIVPGHVNKPLFIAAPILAMIPALATVALIPLGAYFDANGTLVPLGITDYDIGILAVFALTSLAVYPTIIAGWSSNSKYPFLGSVRASAQLISYELSLTLSIVPVFLWTNAPGTAGDLSLFNVVQYQSLPGFWGNLWFIFLYPISALIYLVSLFAETNRQPFDMMESEADLVGGFHTEYGSFKWSLFFVAEYAHMIIGSAIFVLLFLGGWNPLPFVTLADLAQLLRIADLPVLMATLGVIILLIKTLAFIFFFMWVRWTLPRFRYDQVMRLGWHTLLPLSIANLLVYIIAIALLT